MSDKTFEWSLTALFILCMLWIVLGIVLKVLGYLWLGIFGSIVTGLIVLIVGGGTLLYFWGKGYMSRM
jgi:hypothetical protein